MITNFSKELGAAQDDLVDILRRTDFRLASGIEGLEG